MTTTETTTPKTYPGTCRDIRISMLPEQALEFIAALRKAENLPGVSFRIGMLADDLERDVARLDRELATREA